MARNLGFECIDMVGLRQVYVFLVYRGVVWGGEKACIYIINPR
jgi:hypothetical protein